jgi:peptide/nickel transport system substrate-binding protein
MYKKRLSRRRFLAGSAAAAAAGLVVIKCGGGGGKTSDQASPTSTGGGQPRRGGVIRLATTAPAASLNPHTDTTLFGAAGKYYTYGYLVHVTDWGDFLHGDIAESWEQVDDLNWVFHIRPNANFHNVDPVNGRRVVAGDIAYSYKLIETTPGASLTGWNEWITGYEAPDDNTFNVHTSKPYAYIFMTLGSPRMAIVPKEAVEKFGDMSSTEIGSGPFMVKTWDRNTGIEVARNPAYYRTDIPYLDGLKWNVMADDAAIQAAFRAGAIDVYPATDKGKAQSVSSVSGASAQKYRNRLYAVFIMNAARVPAFKDVRVRQAVDLALDRQTMIDKLFMGDGELCGPVGPSWDTALPADEIKKAYTRDVTKAKQLLSAAGQENLSFKLACASYADNADRAAIIQQNLKEAGIDVQIDAKELVSWYNDMLGVNYEANTYANLAYLSDDIQLQNHYSTSFNRSMYYGVDDAEVDAMLLQIQSTVDPAARKELAWEVQRKVLDRHGPVLTLYEPYSYWVAYDYIKNYQPSPWGFGMYKYDMWLDKA